ncbi:MAG: hypothetical protein ACXU9U_01225 [Parachlamydiaceae bacterium]
MILAIHHLANQFAFQYHLRLAAQQYAHQKIAAQSLAATKKCLRELIPKMDGGKGRNAFSLPLKYVMNEKSNENHATSYFFHIRHAIWDPFI